MSFELDLFHNNTLIQKQAVDEILKCNDETRRFGLVLTEKQAAALAKTRAVSLKSNGRIEFGNSAIDKLIHAFCSSPYISASNYEETLHELIDIFYYYKNETFDLINDADLIAYMKKAFNGTCEGSLELLAERELYQFAAELRGG